MPENSILLIKLQSVRWLTRSGSSKLCWWSFTTSATVTARIDVERAGLYLLFIMFLNSFSPAVWPRVSNDGESGGTKRQHVLRRMNASIRCRSTAVVNPHHALDAYCSLAMTTEGKTICSPFHSYVKLWEHRVSVRTNFLLSVHVLRRTDCLLLVNSR